LKGGVMGRLTIPTNGRRYAPYGISELRLYYPLQTWCELKRLIYH